MRICFVAWTTFGHGGIQRTLTTLINELSKKHDVSVLSLKNKFDNVYGLDLERTTIDFIEQSGLSKLKREIIRILAKPFRLYQSKLFVRNYKRIRYTSLFRGRIVSFLNLGKYDVIVAGSGLDESIMLSSFSDEIIPPIVGWLHTSYEYYFLNKPIGYHDFAINCLRKLQHVVVLSKNDQLIYNAKGVRCKYIYNSIQHILPIEQGGCRQARFIYAGALSYCKGADLLVKSYLEYKRLGGTWSLAIFGEGPCKDGIKQEILEADMGQNVALFGYSDNIELEFQKSMALLFTSRYEGFGVVLIEALAARLGIVASDIPITRELLNGRTDVKFFESADIVSIANAMLQISNAPIVIDDVMFIEYFSPQSIAGEWELLLQDI